MFAMFVAAVLAQAPAEMTVPFKLLPSRHMLLSVKLNGTGPYNLIFDTGAPLNLVNSRVAKAAKLTKAKSGGFGFTLWNVQQVQVGSFTVGGVTAEKLPAVVMDHPTVGAISTMFADQFGPIEGIVGFPFFARYAATIDYQARSIKLKPNGFKPGDYLTDLTSGLMKAGERSNEPRVVGAVGLWGFAVETAADQGPGVTVVAVYDGSPAAIAGLKAGDRLLTLDNRWTDSVNDTYVAASLVKPGRSATLKLKRDEQSLTLKVSPVNGY